MALLTAEQVLAVRLRNSKPYKIDELDLELRIVKMSAAAAFEVEKLRVKLQAGAAEMSELILMMLMASCADTKGKLLDKPAAEQILGLMSLDAMNALVASVNPTPAGGEPAPGNSEGSPPIA